MAHAASSYIMGHTDRERLRLSLQGSIINPSTERFLRRAGIAPGMRVLDLGCGVGEVSLLIAGIVGPGGRVTGVDMDPVALEIARTRAGEAGLAQVAFEEANLSTYEPAQKFDAVMGRHILIHTPEPMGLIHKAASAVRPGGIVAFQEFDCLNFIHGFPRQPLAERVMGWITGTLRETMTHADCGPRLYHWLQSAGLKSVAAHGDVMIDGGPDCPHYSWIAESTRSIMHLVESSGMATAEEIDIDTLAARLRQETLDCNGSTAGVLMVGAHGRV
jgi:ubiquinone/menaquinone biosynthesis C-methylase UbiE